MALLSFDGSPHGGKLMLLPEWNSQPKTTPRTIIDHSQVGSSLGTYYYFRDSTGIESHFSITKPGVIWQFMDTDREADANFNANSYAISVETEDNGDPNNDPWTGMQLNSLVWLHDKLATVHPTIPRRVAVADSGTQASGIGYHSLFGSPSNWTPAVGKTCPGKPIRVAQWTTTVVPAFLHMEVDMDEATFRRIVAEEVAKVNDYRVQTYGDVQGEVGGSDTHSVNLEAILDAVRKLQADVTALKTPTP